MNKLLLGVLVASPVPALVVFAGAFAALGGSASSGTSASQTCTLTTPATATTGGGATAAGATLSAAQMQVASTIVSVTKGMNLTERDAAIGVMTGMQESALTNIHYGDAAGPDSRGVFQQRPMYYPGVDFSDPASEASAFFTKEATVSNRGTLPMHQVAHIVQINAIATDYTKWEPLGVAVAEALWGGTGAAGLTCTSTDTTVTVPAGAPTLTPTGNQAIDTARTWALAQLGTSYQFGGSCTDSHAAEMASHCDCASLVQQAYRAAGVTIPRTTFEQYLIGTAVTITEAALQPGDLLFEDGDDPGPGGAPGHVGMYLGQGLVIEAPATGDVVKIQPLAHWLPEITYARRIVN